MKVLSVVGARPQFVKLAAMAEAFDGCADIDHVIVHTGQHYAHNMSEVFFADLKIPAPDVNLGVGSASHGVQTGAILSAIEPVLQRYRPDWTVVYGDTNSTLAAALAAVKLHLPVAHLEAGLRSFNRQMPEEHNRVLTDHAADLLLAPTAIAMGHLSDEGLAGRAVEVGDVMTDVCLRTRDAVRQLPAELPPAVDYGGRYLVATVHRAENTDDAMRLERILAALGSLEVPVVLLAHPRLVATAARYGIPLDRGSVHPARPLSYPAMIRALMGSIGVVTDSGGLQKEAYLLGIPCTTVRHETEWVETLDDGWNILDPDLAMVAEIAVRARPAAAQSQPYGDGTAARRVLRAIRDAS
jgi:UDP-N-acetylglucosamine 2-epimerase (non-hydrolysing)